MQCVCVYGGAVGVRDRAERTDGVGRIGAQGLTGFTIRTGPGRGLQSQCDPFSILADRVCPGHGFGAVFNLLVKLATEHAVNNNIEITGVSQFQLVRNFLSHVASFKAQQQQQTSAPVMSYAEPAPIGFMSQQQSLDAPMIMEIPSRTI